MLDFEGIRGPSTKKTNEIIKKAIKDQFIKFGDLKNLKGRIY